MLVHYTRAYHVKIYPCVHLQLLIQVLSVSPNILTELKPPLNVCSVNKIIHVQDMRTLLLMTGKLLAIAVLQKLQPKVTFSIQPWSLITIHNMSPPHLLNEGDVALSHEAVYYHERL